MNINYKYGKHYNLLKISYFIKQSLSENQLCLNGLLFKITLIEWSIEGTLDFNLVIVFIYFQSKY